MASISTGTTEKDIKTRDSEIMSKLATQEADVWTRIVQKRQERQDLLERVSRANEELESLKQELRDLEIQRDSVRNRIRKEPSSFFAYLPPVERTEETNRHQHDRQSQAINGEDSIPSDSARTLHERDEDDEVTPPPLPPKRQTSNSRVPGETATRLGQASLPPADGHKPLKRSSAFSGSATTSGSSKEPSFKTAAFSTRDETTSTRDVHHFSLSTRPRNSESKAATPFRSRAQSLTSGTSQFARNISFSPIAASFRDSNLTVDRDAEVHTPEATRRYGGFFRLRPSFTSHIPFGRDRRSQNSTS